MDKLCFNFTVIDKPDDAKSNIYAITSITTPTNQTYVLPKELQPLILHKEILKCEIVQKVKASLKRKYEKREVWITLTDELKAVYINEGNIQFEGFLLEKIEGIIGNTTTEEHLLQLIESMKVNGKEDGQQHKNKLKLLDKEVLDKFSGKITNIHQWLNNFESECTRLNVTTDIDKIEMLRLFMKESAMDWYNSMMIKNSINSEWSIWKNSLCETFSDNGWSPVRYAFNYRYKQGSILEYALKKERLLLEINKSIDTQTLINLIVTGLPNYIADKIDREKLKTTNDLFNNIKGLEPVIKKTIRKEKYENSTTVKSNTRDNKSPCSICKKENRGIRFHSESSCWFKNKQEDKQKPAYEIMERKIKPNEKKNSNKDVATIATQEKHWSLGLINDMNNPTFKVIEDDSIVVIKDKYPKAKFHYLVLPKENIPTIWEITKSHENLLRHMDDVAEELTRRHPEHKFLIGYHAMPSMQRMHLHVISTDFDSPCLKTKHHWNTFTTPYFMHSKELCRQLKENGVLKKISSTTSEIYLNSELKCHQCPIKPKNMLELKKHLISHVSGKKE